MGGSGSGRVSFEATPQGRICEQLESARYAVIDALDALKAQDLAEREAADFLQKVRARRHSVMRELVKANHRLTALSLSLGEPGLAAVIEDAAIAERVDALSMTAERRVAERRFAS